MDAKIGDSCGGSSGGGGNHHEIGTPPMTNGYHIMITMRYVFCYAFMAIC